MLGFDKPTITGQPEPGDVVQVLMTEEMARRFERCCLGVNTRSWTELSLPLLFSADDVPTYIVKVGRAAEHTHTEE